MSTEQEQHTVNIGDNNSNNSISVFGMDIHKSISTGIIIGCLIVCTFAMGTRYDKVSEEVHAIKLEQEKIEFQVERITQHIEKSQK